MSLLAALALFAACGGTDAQRSLAGVSLEALAGQLGSGATPGRREAARELARRGLEAGAARGALLEGLGDPDERVREYCALALALASADDARVIDALIRLQEDASKTVGAMATQALDMIDPASQLAHVEYRDPVVESVERTRTIAAHYAWKPIGCSAGEGDPDEEVGACFVLVGTPALSGTTEELRTLSPGRRVWVAGEDPEAVDLSASTPPAPRLSDGASASIEGGFHWHERLADAQAEARATSRLLLVGSTKPGCPSCEKFRHVVVPEFAADLNAVVVGYLVDATRPESRAAWNALRANLPGSHSMPLVGFFTSEMDWITGFGGDKDEKPLAAALAVASHVHERAGEGVRFSVPHDLVPVGEDRSGEIWCYVRSRSRGGAAFGEWRWERRTACEVPQAPPPVEVPEPAPPPGGLPPLVDEDVGLEFELRVAPSAVVTGAVLRIEAHLENASGHELTGVSLVSSPGRTDGLEVDLGPEASVGTLQPEEERDIVIRVKGVREGDHVLQVGVRADGILPVYDTRSVSVIGCALELHLEVPRVIHRDAPEPAVLKVRCTGAAEGASAVIRIERTGVAGEGFEDFNVPPIAPGGDWDLEIPIPIDEDGQGGLTATWVGGEPCGAPDHADFEVAP